MSDEPSNASGKPSEESVVSAAGCFDIDDLIMSTTCYYLGRRTIAVGSFCRQLRVAWPMLSKHVRDFIQRVVEHEFERDDRLRKAGSVYRALGSDCDRSEWETILYLWSR